MDKNKIGIKLKRLREQTAYSIDEVASICEITFYELKDIEQGAKHPSDSVLKLLLGLYKVTDKDLMQSNFINHNKRKTVINYLQLGIAILLIVAYALPFAMEHYGNEGATRPLASGFSMLFNNQFGYPNVISILFLLLILQVILHVLLYTKFKKFSNVFKVIFLMVDVTSVLLFYIDFKRNGNSEATLWILIALFTVHMFLTIYDLMKYPLEHDALADKEKMRRWFLLAVNSAYAIAFTWIITDLIRYPYDMRIGDYIMFVLWGTYLLVYLFINKSVFESRKNVTITLLFPPVVFTILYTVLMIGSEDIFEAGMVFIILFMFLPALVINVDYFIIMIRERITKGDTKEL